MYKSLACLNKESCKSNLVRTPLPLIFLLSNFPSIDPLTLPIGYKYLAVARIQLNLSHLLNKVFIAVLTNVRIFSMPKFHHTVSLMRYKPGSTWILPVTGSSLLWGRPFRSCARCERQQPFGKKTTALVSGRSGLVGWFLPSNPTVAFSQQIFYEPFTSNRRKWNKLSILDRRNVLYEGYEAKNNQGKREHGIC